eukprot:1377524-Rhodomonas_salina.1
MMYIEALLLDPVRARTLCRAMVRSPRANAFDLAGAGVAWRGVCEVAVECGEDKGRRSQLESASSQRGTLHGPHVVERSGLHPGEMLSEQHIGSPAAMPRAGLHWQEHTVTSNLVPLKLPAER